MIYGTKHGDTRAWNIATKETAGIMRGAHGKAITCVSWSPKGNKSASGGGDGTVDYGFGTA